LIQRLCVFRKKVPYKQLIFFAVPGATTIHHWAGMRDNRYTNQHLLELLQNDISLKSSRHRILKVDTFIIDEISTISAKVFDQLEFVCRCLRQNNKLFGDIQIIVSGDFGQLPPVANET
jgi:ATP-dependent DNA helicase PIF1